jgi:glycolate oxidase iron-sulfur subunit
MQTHFTTAQLADPETAESNRALRACVHCGFCTQACPTYRLLGDERDSPRGRIWLAREFLESDAPPSSALVRHMDRCLSCLACMPACPSGVHYQHLIDHVRAEIEDRYRRPILERAFRALIARVLPYPTRFRAVLAFARLAAPLGRILPARFGAALSLARVPVRPAPSVADDIGAEGAPRGRVAMISGCVQSVLAPAIDSAARRLLARAGFEVVVIDGAACCGAMAHHLGRANEARAQARVVIEGIAREIEGAGVDFVVETASGCGTMIKEYGYLFQRDPDWAARAEVVSSRARDLSEVLAEVLAGGDVDFTKAGIAPLAVAWQAPCSLTHGQKVTAPPTELLTRAGFTVTEPDDGGSCCGSAGAYNLLQPKIASALGAAKAEALGQLGAEVTVSSNIGCMTQLGASGHGPVVHIAEILDWAAGGPKPGALSGLVPPLG